MTVSLEAIRTACGKGFPRPAEAIGDSVPGDAWMPDDRIKRGKIVVDLATRKVGNTVGARLPPPVIASEAKQSIPQLVEAWIASSLRSSQ
jgi:hypothetical protein